MNPEDCADAMGFIGFAVTLRNLKVIQHYICPLNNCVDLKLQMGLKIDCDIKLCPLNMTVEK